MTLRDDLQASLGTAYVIERELGGGGMSRVFVAEERALNRKVVVKVLPDELAGSVSTQRFRREIALAARLHHPHIVPLLTAGETSHDGATGIVYYTMPFIVGETLRERLQREPMGAGETVRILREVASGLAYAHAHNVVHRDIKPENILLAGGVAAVTDFGIAKAVASAVTAARTLDAATLTSFGMTLGTPTYMAPEQAAADPDVDHRADIYSLGCVAYEMLAGKAPFAGPPQRVLAAHIAETPATLDTAGLNVPRGLAALVMRCLSKRPEDRPQSAEELVRELDALVVTSDARLPARRAFMPVTRGGVVALAALAVAVLAVVVGRYGGIATAHAATRSVGIIPFDNLSAERDNAYFSEGITQEIADALGKVPGLRIAAERPSPTGARDTRDARAIGRALGVETVLFGSVQRTGDRVHITARLVNASDGYQIWSDRYNREFKDVFAVQEELARAIVGGLRMRLGDTGDSALVKVATVNPEAHRLYLLGMYYWNRRTVPMLRKSMDTFRAAIALDSNYAAPYAGLALAYAVIVDYQERNVAATSDSAIAAGRAALARDSTSSDAWTAIAEAHANRFENAQALTAFAHAVKLDPNNARARQWYGELLAHVHRFDEARVQIYRALDLEPLTLIINANVGRVELEARHYPEAKIALKRAIDIDSTQQTAHQLLSAVYLAEGKTDSAVAEYEFVVKRVTGLSISQRAILGYTYQRAGRIEDAKEMLRQIESRAPQQRISYGAYALLLASLGQTDRAAAALDSAVAMYDATFKMRSAEPAYDPLRRDPRMTNAFARAESVH